MSRRARFPGGQRPADPDQALRQFVGQSPWDDQAVMTDYRCTMTQAPGSPQGIFVADDPGLPEQGKHSVGVAHQYCGAPGKNANCQVAASLHYVGPRGHFPLAMRPYLPQKWIDDPARLDKVGVPPEARAMRTKGEVVLELLDRVRAEGVPGRLVVADAGYGVSESFRDGLVERGLRYIAGVTGEMVVFQAEPTWDDPAPRPPISGGDGRRPARDWRRTRPDRSR